MVSLCKGGMPRRPLAIKIWNSQDMCELDNNTFENHCIQMASEAKEWVSSPR